MGNGLNCNTRNVLTKVPG